MQTALDLDGKIKATMSLRAAGGRKCLSVHVLDGTAAAPYEAAWCRSNRESIQNQRSERHRSQRSVLLRVLGTMSVHDRMEGRCRTNGARGTRVGSAAARQHAGDHSLRRAIATSRANATPIDCLRFFAAASEPTPRLPSTPSIARMRGKVVVGKLCHSC